MSGIHPVADIWTGVLPYQLRMQQAGLAAPDVTRASRSYASLARPESLPARYSLFGAVDPDCQRCLQEGAVDGRKRVPLSIGKPYL